MIENDDFFNNLKGILSNEMPVYSTETFLMKFWQCFIKFIFLFSVI